MAAVAFREALKVKQVFHINGLLIAVSAVRLKQHGGQRSVRKLPYVLLLVPMPRLLDFSAATVWLQ